MALSLGALRESLVPGLTASSAPADGDRCGCNLVVRALQSRLEKLNARMPLLLLLLIIPGMAAAIALGLDRHWRGARPNLAIVLSALPFPSILVGLGAWALLLPNPDHRDGPGYIFLGALFTAPIAATVGLVAGAVALALRRARQSDRSPENR
jgi:hypothetical protein